MRVLFSVERILILLKITFKFKFFAIENRDSVAKSTMYRKYVLPVSTLPTFPFQTIQAQISVRSITLNIENQMYLQTYK